MLPILLNGSEYQFLLDSGNFTSTISHAAVEALDVPYIKAPRFEVYHVDGVSDVQKATVKEVRIGSLLFPNLAMAYYGNSVKEYKNEDKTYGGRLSFATLASYDVEIDLYAKKFNVFSQDDCGSSVVYWAKEATYVDLEGTEKDMIIFQTIMNGKEFRSRLMTTDSQTLISWRNANEMGLSEDSPDVTPGRELTFGLKKTIASNYILKSLQIGGEKLTHFPIEIADFRLKLNEPTGSHITRNDQAVEASIGLDFLFRNHVYIAKRDGKMYFTPYTGEQTKAIMTGSAAAPSGSQ